MHFQGTNNNENPSSQIPFDDQLIYIIPSSLSLPPSLINENHGCGVGAEITNDDSSKSIIVIERSHVGRPEPTHVRPWSTSIFGCFSDLPSCLQTFLCPCKTSGQVYEILSEGKTSCWEGAISYCIAHLMGCTCIFYLWHIRTKMRKEYKLEGNKCTDCLASSCCLQYCALCQQYRELNQQGFDPSLGWHENIQRQKHAIAVYRITPPSVEEKMTRNGDIIDWEVQRRR